MNTKQIQSVKRLTGEVTVPGDKSISHRAVMIGSIADGTTQIHNFLQGDDCLSTISCFRQMGVSIENTGEDIIVQGKGLYGLSAPLNVLDVGNSGTTARLMSGILCGQSFASTLTGDASIRRRPMQRIITPLTQMGASISGQNDTQCAPLQIAPALLHGIHYTSPIASAQVKSCLLLAGLYAQSPTSVTEPYVSRNHSELMLQHFGAQLTTQDTTVTIEPQPHLIGREVIVPGDISSAAYFIAAGLLVPDSEILIKNVGINPTRAGILEVCERMGGDITYLNEHTNSGERSADLLVRSSRLKGVEIGGALIPTLIDEIPILAVLAATAEGTTVIRDAQELTKKESDRIATITSNLEQMGADISAQPDGMIIKGREELHGACINTHLDHRIAMAFSIAALVARGTTEIQDASCTAISYPNFYHDLESLIM
ncbi:MAG: 3-phosphoshikimate 1-carboxyvinyltransferase [Lachnospiraceae bacterium]